MVRKFWSGICTVLVLLISTGALADHKSTTVTVADMHLFNTDTGVVGVSILTRTKNMLRIDVSTTQLAPNAPYSIWWVIFNKPQHCQHGMAPNSCGILDLPGFGGDPAINASLFWASGAVSTGDGSLNASAEVRRNKPRGQVVMGTTKGVKNVSGAEVHVAIRGHGAAVPGSIAEQLGSFNGGCPPAACPNLQASVHPGN